MKSRFHRLYPYLWRQRWPIAAGLGCLLIGNYLDIQAAVLLGGGVDVAAFDMGKLGGAQSTLLWVFVVLLVALGLLSGVLRYYMRQWIIGASREIETDLRNDVFASALRQSPAFYDRYRTGDLMNRASSDIEAVRVVVGPAVMYMANTLAMLPMALYQMVRISPPLAGLVAIPMLLIAPLFYFFKRGINERFRRTQELMSDLSASVQENLSGVRVIKVHAREAQQATAFEELSAEYVRENLRLARVQAIFIPLLGFLVGLGVLALLWGGGWLILRGSMTIGGLISFFVMMMSSVWPLIAFGWVLAQLERGAASLARIEEILDARPEIEPTPMTEAAPLLRAGLELRGLTFTYPTGNAPALRELTLSVPPGTTLGLTGPVGCGKSTLAALLARRYNPPRGTLLVDGRDILDWPAEGLRRQIGIVDQEPFLFSDTIEANILFGVECAGRSKEALHALAVRAAETAQLAGEIERFPQGYETILGERGINLSGGQRQRAALARAIARDPALLILDDALAAVDTQTEEAILSGLREVLRGRSTLLISHRVSTVALADWIVYLEDGRAVEQGTHEELLARRGAYWRLAQRQQLAEQIAQTA